MNFKQIISDIVNFDGIDKQVVFDSLMLPPDESMGDYSLPCFVFAKTLHKSPVQIANEILQNLGESEYIQKAEVVGGYLNFFLKIV